MPPKHTAEPNAKAARATKSRIARNTAKPIAARKASRKACSNANPSTKSQVCLDLLGRKEGATLEELKAATGWQAHIVRGFLSGNVKKKLGLTLNSSRDDDGNRRYALGRATRGQ